MKHNQKQNKKYSKKQKGGIFFSLQKQFIIPGQHPVGTSYDGGNIETWPGVKGNTTGISESNHYSYNTNVVDPPIKGAYIIGGKNNKRRNKTKRTKRNKTNKRKTKRINKTKTNKTKTNKTKINIRNTQNGGSFIPQDLVNLGRVITNNTSNFINKMTGNETTISPLPYNQPLEYTNQPYNNKPVDIEKIYNESVDKVLHM